VSDGLLADVGHLAADSRVTVDLDGSALERACLQPPGALQQVGAALGVDPMVWVLTGGEDHALVATFPGRTVLPEGWTAIGSVRSGPRRAGVFVDTRSAADVVASLGAEGAGHVHFG